MLLQVWIIGHNSLSDLELYFQEKKKKNHFALLEDISQPSLPKEDMFPNCFSALAEMR